MSPLFGVNASYSDVLRLRIRDFAHFEYYLFEETAKITAEFPKNNT